MLGYYRVNYDERSWQMIINELKGERFTQIPTLNRAQLLDDSFNLAKAGYLNFNTTMNLLSYLSHEFELLPLVAGFRTIEFLIEFLDEQNFYQELRDRMVEIVEKIYVKTRDITSADLNSEKSQLLRLHVNFFACQIGVKACLDDVATRLFLADIEYNRFDIEQRPFLYCGSVSTELASYYWTELKMKIVIANNYNDHLYRANQEEFTEIFAALSLCDRNPNRMERLLTDIFIANPNNTLKDDLPRYDNVTNDNALEVISNLIKTSYVGRSLVMKFYKDHFDAVNEK